MPHTYEDHVDVRTITDTLRGDDMVARHGDNLAIEEATVEQQLEALDNVAQRLLHISGEEFQRRWHAGEYKDLADTPAGRRVIHVSMLLPDVRTDT